jgi:hypothetical protein
MWGGSVHSQAFPELFSSRAQDITICKATAIEDLALLFNLPILEEAYVQLLLFAAEFDGLQISEEDDVWTYNWGTTSYSLIKAYKHLMGSRQVHPCYAWLWEASAQKKHKVFFWLLLKDRLSTRNILRCKNKALLSYNYVLCNLHMEETLEHLFLSCSFAEACWTSLNLFVPQDDPFSVILSFKNQLVVPFFMEITILMSWSIWMARNDLIFRG